MSLERRLKRCPFKDRKNFRVAMDENEHLGEAITADQIGKIPSGFGESNYLRVEDRSSRKGVTRARPLLPNWPVLFYFTFP